MVVPEPSVYFLLCALAPALILNLL
ncbi:PEP-CTERM sorting domain-containing protein [Rheinheimera aquimaris]|nr:PEP-CTERM sorting domain-containing protein [Rheinheimera aquimaris]